jgi:purine-binding chemotaxis protein CheW
MRKTQKEPAADIDWAGVRERLALAAEASQNALRPSAENVQRILQERAAKLSRPLEQPRADAQSFDVLTFALGRERYAVESRCVREVLRLTELAPLPRVPEFVVGVTNLHGEILCVFDLQIFFGFAAKGLTNRAHVVVCAGEKAEFGIIVDAVHEVARLAAEDVRSDTIFESARGRECIRGVTRDAVLFVDLPALMRHPELFIGRSDEPGAARQR